MNRFRKVAIEAAKRAGKILKENFGKKFKVMYKGEIDLVTEVDKKAQNFIINFIKDNFKEHHILAEESKPRPCTQDRGKHRKIKSRYIWYIDPLDGTTNYTHSFPIFSVSIALEIDKEAVLGVVYNPVLDELFFAEKDKGAYLNNEKIYVSKTTRLSSALLATGFPYDIRRSKNNNIGHFINFSKRSQAVRRPGCASLDLAYTACGRFDGFWELKLNTWDMAAGSLLVLEAGGKVTNFDGDKFNLYKKEIIASNGIIHNEMVRIINLKKG